MRIGLEVHVALPLKSKLFCSCSSSAEEPNTAICPICMGFPGSKPMLNERALGIAKSIAAALNCRLNDFISFVRKVYFYPDLPKSYQITQIGGAVGTGGYVQTASGRVGIVRVQIEEDPARIIRGDDYTLLDFNRSGIGLVEIVTEPDMTDEGGMKEFIIELKSILYYLGVDIDQEFKVDLNVSTSGDRVETKNVTGMANIVNALRYEIKRQGVMASKGQRIGMETRSYDEAGMKTVQSREKETEEEYGFIYEPDLGEYDMRKVETETAVYASRIAHEYAKRYDYSESTLRELIMFNREALALIDGAKGGHRMQNIVNAVELLIKYRKTGINGRDFESMLGLVENGAAVRKETIEKIERGEGISGYSAVSEDEVNKEIADIIRSNARLLEDYKRDRKVLNFVIGRVAKKHNADPRYVSEQLRKVLRDVFKVE
ncbi:MAG: hypothetical protein M1354_03245 [Candidatus Marsarchaeota archaeon]|jgi:Asp-tRNAAsn/Glu-tRNAGln amidotransferase B subunit (PET112 homolog)|nr:hypothetical protein [Candidatus Marsarchaeota archaeon]